MNDPNTINILLIILLVMLSAFFSATETAFSSVNKIRLKNYANSGDKKAIRALKISEDYDKALSAVLIGNNIVNIAAASIGTILFTSLFNEMGVAISSIVMTIVVLIFGEITPKSLAKQHPEKFALAVAGIILFAMKLFSPIIWILMKIKNLITKRFDSGDSQPSVTEEELKVIIEEIEDEGVLNQQESELVQSALDFNDITVSEILTPRVDIVAIDKNENPEIIKDIFFKEGYSRLPVYDKSIDNIIGVLNEKDFIRSYIKNKDVQIKKLIQQTTYVPPKKLISELLKELQRLKIHIAVVTDQYGGTLGIITLEDIIEELVGDIWDESDEVEIDVIKLSENTFRVSGDMNIYDLFEQINVNDTLYNSTSQTMSSWALEMFEKIPEKDEFFTFENITVTVEEVVDQRIISFIVTVA